MLYLMMAWLVIGITASLIGTSLLYSLHAQHWLVRLGDRLIVSTWLGIVLLSVAFLSLSLVIPLTPWVGGGLIGGGSGVALLSGATRQEIRRLYQDLSLIKVGVGGAIAPLVAAFFIQPVVWVDTGYYHYGAIRWLAEFGTVPGLALLFKPFGFTSSWFALAAPFNPEVLQHRASAMTNGLVLLLVGLHISHCTVQVYTRRARRSDGFLLIWFGAVILALTGTHLLSVVLVSPSPDIPVILLTGVVAWLMLRLKERSPDQSSLDRSSQHRADLLPVILAAGTVTIKLTALPILAIALIFYITVRGWHYHHVILAAIVSLVILTPMLAVSTLTSGCPLYPGVSLCFDLPWSPTPAEVQRVAAAIQGWQTWFETPPTHIFAPLWLIWQWLNLNHSNKAIALLTVISLVLMIIMMRRYIQRQQTYYGWVIALGLLGISFSLLQAPLLRFNLGYVLLIPSLWLATWITEDCRWTWRLHLSPNLPQRTLRNQQLFYAGILALTGVCLVHGQLKGHLIVPPTLSTVQVEQRQINNVQYNDPQNEVGTCWAASLPCTRYPDPGIFLRQPDRGLQAGFVRMDN